MSVLFRTAVVPFVVGLLTLGVFGLCMTYVPWEKIQELHREEYLQRLRQATDCRIEARRQAVQEWIAQRRTLEEVMQRFQELDREWPDYVTPQRQWYPSDEERHHRLLLPYIEGILQGRPEELAATCGRLEKEYQQLQAGRRTSSAAAITEPRSSGSETVSIP